MSRSLVSQHTSAAPGSQRARVWELTSAAMSTAQGGRGGDGHEIGERTADTYVLPSTSGFPRASTIKELINFNSTVLYRTVFSLYSVNLLINQSFSQLINQTINKYFISISFGLLVNNRWTVNICKLQVKKEVIYKLREI